MIIKYSMRTKNIFLAGANTAEGFVSKFDNILKNDKKAYTFVLKGGPGTGKSTLMKKIATHFREKGFRVEEFYCSSDVKSLDAVRIVEKNICITDGTAPHEQDASLPKVNGEIVDLGESVGKEIIKYKSKINKIILLKKNCFDKAYKFLSLAGSVVDRFNRSKKFNLPEGIKKRTFYFDYFCDNGIKSFEHKNKFKVLNLNKSNAKTFYELLNTQKNIIEIKSTLTGGAKAVIFEDIATMFKTESVVLDANSKQIFDRLCVLAGKNIDQAKTYHKEIEKIYFQYINLKTLDEITKNLIQKIEKF